MEPTRVWELLINGLVPVAESIPDEGERNNILKALQYMGLESGKQLLGMPVQHVFIGSCTNSRIEDLRMVAALVKGRKKHEQVQVMIVPGSQQVYLNRCRQKVLIKFLKKRGLKSDKLVAAHVWA